MTRKTFIERILRQIYNGQPSDDSNITFNLVNQWLNDAIGVAAKKNYTDSIQMDGVAYVNNKPVMEAEMMAQIIKMKNVESKKPQSQEA